MRPRKSRKSTETPAEGLTDTENQNGHAGNGLGASDLPSDGAPEADIGNDEPTITDLESVEVATEAPAGTQNDDAASDERDGNGANADSADSDEEDGDADDEANDELAEITLAELPSKLQQAAQRAGWSTLMPVQAMTIPYLRARRDVMVQSRTGSGKTGAFLLPILERIETKRDVCQALVLTPTRELAQQVAKEATMLAADTGVRSAALYGGVGYGPQLDALRKGAHLVIGTPGRILDHLLRRNLRLDDLQVLVFDEADRMLSMGFYPDMRELQRYLPARNLNAYMFSATYPHSVLRLAHEFLDDPGFLNLSRDHVHVSEAEHVFYMTPVMKRDRSLIRLIEVENPDSAFIFCNTKNTVHYVTVVLQRFGYDADELSSDLNQKDRERVLERVRKGELRFLVATDVAARGIDIPELSHVFQYEPPEDTESYIHRAGRTARAGATGMAISLAENISERLQLERIAKRYNFELEERTLPSEEDVANVVAQRVTTLLEAKLRNRDNLKTERIPPLYAPRDRTGGKRGGTDAAGHVGG
ncbi:MAG: DEAD/DEAH box helicase [Caldilineaceae bacterium]